jgi:hypothetical protein
MVGLVFMGIVAILMNAFIIWFLSTNTIRV